MRRWRRYSYCSCVFFNDPATTEIYTLSLHDALPIFKVGEHTMPAYVAHIGGTFDGGEIGYGTRLKVRLPAKRVPEAVERWVDRKSTRLNSRHANISYGGFCFKKK